MDFLNIGHYIVEPVPTPEYLDLKCKQIITISNCICNTHPSLAGSFYINHGFSRNKTSPNLGSITD